MNKTFLPNCLVNYILPNFVNASNISFWDVLGDEHLKFFANAKSLKLVCCKNITGKGFVYLKKLKCIELIWCENIEDVYMQHLQYCEIIRIECCSNITHKSLLYSTNTKITFNEFNFSCRNYDCYYYEKCNCSLKISKNNYCDCCYDCHYNDNYHSNNNHNSYGRCQSPMVILAESNHEKSIYDDYNDSNHDDSNHDDNNNSNQYDEFDHDDFDNEFDFYT
jgi:hypothetical protein